MGGDPEGADAGSVAAAVLRHSPVPVTLVRAGATGPAADEPEAEAEEGGA